MKRPLTNKQAKFASLVAKGQDKAQAYRSAYNAKKMKQTSIKVEANKLANLPHVADAITSLVAQHEPTERTVEALTNDWIIERLQEEASAEENPPASRVRSLEILGKIKGLFNDQVKVEAYRSPDEIQKELMEKLEKWGVFN